MWDRFYSLPAVWQRSTCVRSVRARLAFVLISKLYRQMYANTGIATDSARVARSARRARWLAKIARRLFVAAPMPELAEPAALSARPHPADFLACPVAMNRPHDVACTGSLPVLQRVIPGRRRRL